MSLKRSLDYGHGDGDSYGDGDGEGYYNHDYGRDHRDRKRVVGSCFFRPLGPVARQHVIITCVCVCLSTLN